MTGSKALALTLKRTLNVSHFSVLSHEEGTTGPPETCFWLGSEPYRSPDLFPSGPGESASDKRNRRVLPLIKTRPH